MVPAADAKQSQVAMSETFLLSNIAPQVGEGFNRHYWAYLEAVRQASLVSDCAEALASARPPADSPEETT
jgi:DNA/RNA endonuclease G (NUC1)